MPYYRQPSKQKVSKSVDSVEGVEHSRRSRRLRFEVFEAFKAFGSRGIRGIRGVWNSRRSRRLGFEAFEAFEAPEAPLYRYTRRMARRWSRSLGTMMATRSRNFAEKGKHGRVLTPLLSSPVCNCKVGSLLGLPSLDCQVGLPSVP